MTKHPSPIYHQSAICQILVECPKSAGQPGHSVPKMWAMRALAVEQCTSRLLTHRNSAINPPQTDNWAGMPSPEEIYTRSGLVQQQVPHQIPGSLSATAPNNEKQNTKTHS